MSVISRSDSSIGALTMTTGRLLEAGPLFFEFRQLRLGLWKNHRTMTGELFAPLTEIERDALSEVSNIAMARASNSLRQMVEHQVLLSVPSVEILSQDAAARLCRRSQNNPKLVAVRQDFSGAFSGRALLIFAEAKSLELVRVVVGRELCRSKISSILKTRR